MITITVTLVLLISAMIFILKEVRRLNSIAERLLVQLERDINPVLMKLNKITDDLATVTNTVRSQVERVDLTTEQVSKNLLAFVETCIKTGYILHDEAAEYARFNKPGAPVELEERDMEPEDWIEQYYSAF